MPRHAIVTGASSGIGEALALELARKGWSVGLIARRAEEPSRLAEQIRAAGGLAAFAPADVTDAEATARALAALEAELGPAELVVANAGGGLVEHAVALEPAKIQRLMQLNFMGVVHTAAAAIPGMAARKRGTLVVVSSVAGARGLPGSATYCASKAAIDVWWETLRIELKREGITCVNIQPGFVRTPLTDKNKFRMPFLLEADEFARRAVRAIERGASVARIPWQMSLINRLQRVMPDWLYDRIMANLGPRRKVDPSKVIPV